MKLPKYHSIAHLPNSKLGISDRHCEPNQAVLATEKAPKDYEIFVEEKLDGANVNIWRVNNELITTIKDGYPCLTAPEDWKQYMPNINSDIIAPIYNIEIE